MDKIIYHGFKNAEIAAKIKDVCLTAADLHSQVDSLATPFSLRTLSIIINDGDELLSLIRNFATEMLQAEIKLTNEIQAIKRLMVGETEPLLQHIGVSEMEKDVKVLSDQNNIIQQNVKKLSEPQNKINWQNVEKLSEQQNKIKLLCDDVKKNVRNAFNTIREAVSQIDNAAQAAFTKIISAAPTVTPSQPVAKLSIVAVSRIDNAAQTASTKIISAAPTVTPSQPVAKLSIFTPIRLVMQKMVSNIKEATIQVVNKVKTAFDTAFSAKKSPNHENAITEISASIPNDDEEQNQFLLPLDEEQKQLFSTLNQEEKQSLLAAIEANKKTQNFNTKLDAKYAGEQTGGCWARALSILAHGGCIVGFCFLLNLLLPGVGAIVGVILGTIAGNSLRHFIEKYIAYKITLRYGKARTEDVARNAYLRQLEISSSTLTDERKKIVADLYAKQAGNEFIVLLEATHRGEMIGEIANLLTSESLAIILTSILDIVTGGLASLSIMILALIETIIAAISSGIGHYLKKRVAHRVTKSYAPEVWKVSEESAKTILQASN
jgi:hypothetical protein